jgi:two-component system, LytTR family, response regulator
VIRALIVDDEPLVRERVRALLGAQPDVSVAGECSDGLAALQAMREVAPDLVFLDIQMPGLGGLDVVEARRAEGPLPLLIFVTAYQQYALDAFRHHAVDYLLKPLDPGAFAAALDRVRVWMTGQERGERAELDGRLQALIHTHERRHAARPHLAVRDGDRYIVVRTPEIHCVEASGNYVTLHRERDSLLLRDTLTALEAKLDRERFVRTHRSWIVNLEHVREALPAARGGGFVLVTDGGHKVPLSPQHRGALDRILG